MSLRPTRPSQTRTTIPRLDLTLIVHSGSSPVQFSNDETYY